MGVNMTYMARIEMGTVQRVGLFQVRKTGRKKVIKHARKRKIVGQAIGGHNSSSCVTMETCTDHQKNEVCPYLSLRYPNFQQTAAGKITYSSSLAWCLGGIVSSFMPRSSRRIGRRSMLLLNGEDAGCHGF